MNGPPVYIHRRTAPAAQQLHTALLPGLNTASRYDFIADVYDLMAQALGEQLFLCRLSALQGRTAHGCNVAQCLELGKIWLCNGAGQRQFDLLLCHHPIAFPFISSAVKMTGSPIPFARKYSCAMDSISSAIYMACSMVSAPAINP